jgi:transposase
MKIHTIGIDLGKTSFHIVGLNERGEVVVRKRFSRAQVLRFTANRKVHVIGMEACGGAHFLGRALQQQGHEVRLIPAQYVKPYVKTNKNDYIDAEAIAEAVCRPTMRFVPIKSDDQLDLQSLHRVRERWVMRRTAVINQIRGLLLERWITLRKGRRYLEAALPGILEDADAKLSGTLRLLLAQLKLELDQTALRLEEAEALIAQTVQENEACQRLVKIPGIGPVTATAVIAAIGNGAVFRKGREFAAWMGVVPREYSTGGKQKLLGISLHFTFLPSPWGHRESRHHRSLQTCCLSVKNCARSSPTLRTKSSSAMRTGAVAVSSPAPTRWPWIWTCLWASETGAAFDFFAVVHSSLYSMREATQPSG